MSSDRGVLRERSTPPSEHLSAEFALSTKHKKCIQVTYCVYENDYACRLTCFRYIYSAIIWYIYLYILDIYICVCVRGGARALCTYMAVILCLCVSSAVFPARTCTWIAYYDGDLIFMSFCFPCDVWSADPIEKFHKYNLKIGSWNIGGDAKVKCEHEDVTRVIKSHDIFAILESWLDHEDLCPLLKIVLISEARVKRNPMPK